VALTEVQVFCSCADALYRGSVCKHATTLALAILRGEKKGAKSSRTIHLATQEGTALCGLSHPLHMWKRRTGRRRPGRRAARNVRQSASNLSWQRQPQRQRRGESGDVSASP
jgi:hypothetical protein